MKGTYLVRGPGKARGSYLQLLIGLVLGTMMIVAAGCSPTPEPTPEAVNGGGPGPDKNGVGSSATNQAVPSGETAEDKIGTKAGGK